MTVGRLKLIRLALLLLAVALGIAVVTTIQAPVRTGAVAPALPTAPAQKGATQTRQGELLELKGGDARVKVRFGSMTGQQPNELRLEDVELTFGYVAQGQPGTATVTAREARYTVALQKAHFEGHVVVTTADGFELRSETLDYRGDKGLLRTDDRVDFKRKRASGSSQGMRYETESGRIDFPAEAAVRVEYVQAPALEIHGGRAELDRGTDELRFFDGVTCTRGSDNLKAGRLVLAYAKDRRALNSVQAFDGAELILTGATGASLGMAGGSQGAGRREIRAPGLGLWFRPDGSLEEASAFFNAELLLWPAAGEPQERRSLRAKLLIFRFDGESRLREVQAQKQAAVHSEPISPAKGETQDVHSKQLQMRFVPASGELEGFDARGDFEFAQGTRRASAERGRYQASSGRLLLLKGQPSVEELRRTRIGAERIELMTRSGDLVAKGDVRQTVFAAPESRGFLVQPGQPTLLSAEKLVHDAARGETRYTGQALLRSGKDEVRAEQLQIAQDPKGGRRLDARDHVFSLLHPAEKAGSPPGLPIEVRAGSMRYDETGAQVVYSGDVTLRQGDVSTVSPSATLALASDGRSLRQLVAGEPVELTQGKRKATGQRAIYTPGNQTIVVDGNPVTLVGPGQDIRGLSLTFQTGNDRILVSGQEEGRTETVFRKEPPKP